MSDRTAAQIIDDAYELNGVHVASTALSAAQLATALRFLQNMLSSWSAEGLMVPSLVTENFTLTSGQAVYTIGVTGDSPDLVTSTGRPIRITNAWIRVTNTDYPVRVIMTKSEYNRVSDKTLEGRPRNLYYDPQYPTGKIKFDYEADSTYDFHLVSEKPLVNPALSSTTFSLPLEYNKAMVYNLAVELAIGTVNTLPQSVFQIALESKEVIENMNAQDQLSDSVKLDPAMYGRNYHSLDIVAGA